MSLNDKIKEAVEQVEKEKEEQKLQSKKWRLPRKAKVGKKKQRLNWVGILKINENGSIEPSKQQIKEQTIVVDGCPRLATNECVLRWVHGRKTFPVILLESWSTIPYSPQDSVRKSMLDGSNAIGYNLLWNRMQNDKVEQKKHMGGWWKWLLGLALLGVVVYAFASGSIF